MANLIQTSPNSQFAVASFLEACHVEAFHSHWMSANTWADLIQHDFNLTPELKFTGKDLVKALTLWSNKKLREAMDVSSIKLTNPKVQPEFTAFMQQQEDLSPTIEITGF